MPVKRVIYLQVKGSRAGGVFVGGLRRPDQCVQDCIAPVPGLELSSMKEEPCDVAEAIAALNRDHSVYRQVLVICNVSDMRRIAQELRGNGGQLDELRHALRTLAFFDTTDSFRICPTTAMAELAVAAHFVLLARSGFHFLEGITELDERALSNLPSAA